ncbi:DUF1996 domain-containing protein [Nonomuraea sp. NPDC050405]|uniref:DUF1996 domain-containing protein n=1 Tax=Nonomuraea sp. NPDC050405 TaxID=3154509 RepID=UPI0033DA3CE5
MSSSLVATTLILADLSPAVATTPHLNRRTGDAVPADKQIFQIRVIDREECRMRGASRGRPFKPWLTLFGGIVLLLATGPSPQQGAGVLRLSSSTGLVTGFATTGTNAAAETIVCPGVADRLLAVPAAAREEVDRNLALLERQIAEANARLVSSAGEGGPNFVQNAILGPLEDKRVATVNRIATAIGRVAARPEGLVALAPCALSDSGTPGSTASASASAAPEATEPGAGDPAAIGPTADDFVDIRQVARAEQPRGTDTGSRGTYDSRCGTPRETHANEEDLITAPGVQDGAQQLHDYVGNMSADAFSTNESLAAAGTTCVQRGDRSAYFWPALRARAAGDVGAAATEPATTATATGTEDAQADQETNVGTPVKPVAVRIQYRGNPASPVTAMPRFLRVLSGDPRALTDGDADVRAAWSCTGFTDRLTDKYPICPSGSDLVRVHDMPSCWDGENTDSATHRSHLVFPGEDGACPSGTRAVPQLRLTLVYGELPGTRPEGTDVPFALDSFASERHAPQTAHAGAVVVMSDRLMRTVVRCLNTGRTC